MTCISNGVEYVILKKLIAVKRAVLLHAGRPSFMSTDMYSNSSQSPCSFIVGCLLPENLNAPSHFPF